MYHGEDDGLFSQGVHSLAESETKLAMATQWSECSAERGNTGDPDDGRVGSGLKETLLKYLNLKLYLGVPVKVVE